MDQTLKIILSVLMMALLSDVVWQVFSRYVLRDPSSFTDELARYLMIWVALLGAAYVTGQKWHIAIDLVASKINSVWLDRFIHLTIGTFATLVLVFGGIKLVKLTLELEQKSAALQIPLGYVYSVLPLSGIAILIYTVIALFESKIENS